MLDSVKYIHGGKFTSRGIWKHPDRTIDSNEIILVIRGKVHITEGNTEYTLDTGDVLRLDKGTRHFGREDTHERVVFYWLHFWGDEKDLPPKYLSIGDIGETELICRQILHYEKSGAYPAEMTDYLMRVLIMELRTAENRLQKLPGKLTCDICEWIRINCDLPIKVKDVAERFGYNEDYLCRLFKRSHNIGMKEYIDSERMRRIRHRITEGEMSLKEIAAEFSFSEYKYFLKYFKYHEGISPTAYRETYSNLHMNNS